VSSTQSQRQRRGNEAFTGMSQRACRALKNKSGVTFIKRLFFFPKDSSDVPPHSAQ